MVTLRQTYDICKKGYRYDIEHDRFISDKEDFQKWKEMYGPASYRIGLFVKKAIREFKDLYLENPDYVNKRLFYKR